MTTARCVVCAVVLVLSLVTYSSAKPLQDVDKKSEEGPEPLDEYIRSFGYPVETHDITTEDGYVLTYYRIPHGKDNATAGGRPVLVQHGVTAVAAVWVSVQDSLGFVLADAGFDVWLGNARGTTFSRKHIKYDPDKDKKKFWDFSWHEMGYYDLPASIDYILSTTGHTELMYAGHSMGTTMFMVLGATRPEYMDKVASAVLMAPVAYLSHVKAPLIRLAADFEGLLVEAVKTMRMYELFSFSNSSYHTAQTLCGNLDYQFMCQDLIFAFSGYDSEEVNSTLFTTYLKYLPGGTSYKVYEHYGQLIKSGKFQYLDYGLVGNLMHYRSRTPPLYDLGKVTAPVHVFYGNNDWLATPMDALQTAAELHNVVQIVRVPYDQWTHMDFQFATHARALVYDPIVTIFQNTNSIQ